MQCRRRACQVWMLILEDDLPWLSFLLRFDVFHFSAHEIRSFGVQCITIQQRKSACMGRTREGDYEPIHMCECGESEMDVRAKFNNICPAASGP